MLISASVHSYTAYASRCIHVFIWATVRSYTITHNHMLISSYVQLFVRTLSCMLMCWCVHMFTRIRILISSCVHVSRIDMCSYVPHRPVLMCSYAHTYIVAHMFIYSCVHMSKYWCSDTCLCAYMSMCSRITHNHVSMCIVYGCTACRSPSVQTFRESMVYIRSLRINTCSHE